MSNRYEAAVTVTAAPAAGAAFAELRNGSTRPMLIEELGISLGAATATRVGLIRATAQGAGGTIAAGLPEDPTRPNATPVGLVAAAFTTAPTFSTAYMRRFGIGAAIGGGIIWTWPQSDRLLIPVNASVVLVNIGAAAGAATIDAYAIWTE